MNNVHTYTLVKIDHPVDLQNTKSANN